MRKHIDTYVDVLHTSTFLNSHMVFETPGRCDLYVLLPYLHTRKFMFGHSCFSDTDFDEKYQYKSTEILREISNERHFYPAIYKKKKQNIKTSNLIKCQIKWGSSYRYLLFLIILKQISHVNTHLNDVYMQVAYSYLQGFIYIACYHKLCKIDLKHFITNTWGKTKSS